MKKIIFTAISIIFSIVLLLEVQSVLAHNGEHNKPISSPVSSPVTSPCKPGWGFGDKNHCHDKDFNPGKGHDNDKDDQHKNDNHNNNGHHDDHNNKPFVSPLGHKDK